MDRETVAQQVRNFVIENYLFGQDKKFSDHDSFLEQGIIDSTAVLELVNFVQDTYGVEVEDEELIPDNLDSITNVSAYVARKLQGMPLVTVHSASEISPEAL
jgi:acyl carrier protein